jgi:ribonuclease PH
MASKKKHTTVICHSGGTRNPKVPWSRADQALLLKLQAEMLPGSTYEQLAWTFNASGPQQQRTVNALTKKLNQYRTPGG